MRYYEQRYPEVDELVMVQVRQIAEMGAYVKLVSGSSHIIPYLSFLFLFLFVLPTYELCFFLLDVFFWIWNLGAGFGIWGRFWEWVDL